MKPSPHSPTAVFFMILALFFLAGCIDSQEENAVIAPSAASTPGTPANISTSDIEFTGRYIILGRGANLPRNLETAISNAGGTLIATLPEIAVAIAEAEAPDFSNKLQKLQGIESVTPDLRLQWTDPVLTRGNPELTYDGGGVGAMNLHEAAAFGFLQWAPEAIGAPEAWAAGFTGSGVRVAVLDGGLHNTHVDLAPNIDVAASISFIPGFDFNEDTGTFWHGTHVAGIIGSSGLGTVGIAPNATLIGVKVLHGGSGPFAALLQGIVYAANPVAQGGAGAHIINMSLGAVIDYRNNWNDKDFRTAFRELMKAVDRATRYANQQGVTVIAAAGNEELNFDVQKEFFSTPAQNHSVISISATGPHGWALGAVDFERPAYYTNHGKSIIDLSGPGGTIGLFLIDGFDGICNVGGVLQFCETFDMILSTVRGPAASTGSYGWAQGTSMAAPVITGIAALVIEKNGGAMNPNAVGSQLRQAGIDFGKPGNDEWYGHGWVSAAKAVGALN
jgi:lantibiotic leader peptide-processing serine protease